MAHRDQPDPYFGLMWVGKEECKALADTPANSELKLVDDSSSNNIFIEGENLEVLKLLQKSYAGKVKMIYIDPPYNTGKDFVYSDNFVEKEKDYLKRVAGVDEKGKPLATLNRTDGRYHSKWLSMMYPRLKLARNLLSEDGVIFISIDDNEVANLRLLCDEIFGGENFVGQWNWFKSATPPNLSKKIKKNIEYVLAYQRGDNNSVFKGIIKTSKSDDPFTKPQNSIKELIFPKGSINIKSKVDLIPKGIYGTDKYPNELLNNIEVEDGKNKNDAVFKNKFIWVQDKLEEEIQNGTTINLSSNGVLSYKKAEYGEEVPPNLIDASVKVDTTENAGKDLQTLFNDCKVFDYPKPVSLIKYLTNFCTSDSDLILDFFAGSGTTAHAVMQLNAEGGGNRRWICVQMPEVLDEKSEAYKAGFRTIADICKERIKRASAKIQTEHPDYQGDLGFKEMKLSLQAINSNII